MGQAPHSHDHAHGHSHGHAHHHSAVKSVFWGLVLNLSFTIIEIVGGLWTGSIAILADAMHDLGDSASLAMALYFERYSLKRGDRDYSFGYRRFSLLSAVISGIVILAGGIVILCESIPRLAHPGTPNAPGMIALAVVGLAVNGVAALRLTKGSSHNEKMLGWHFIEDTLGWAATLVAALIMRWKGWAIVDPLLAIGLSLFVMWNVGRRLKQTLRLFLQGTPEDFDRKSFVERVQALPHVKGLHDLHVWSLDGERHVLSLHIVLGSDGPPLGSDALTNVKRSIAEIANKQHAHHVTIETEWSGEDCTVNCDETN